MKTTKVNGVELEYEMVGSGEPLLLISPIIPDGFLPLSSASVLVEDYRLIRYHKRGWVRSTHTPPPVSISDHARDAAALLDRLNIRRAHVAGHSSGGPVVMQLALQRPDLVHTLVLLEPLLFSVPAAGAFVEQARPAFEAYQTGDHQEAVAHLLSAVSGLEWDECRTLMDKHVPGGIAQAVMDAVTLFGIELPSLSEWTFSADEAAAITQPVLSVTGSETEPLFVEAAEWLLSSMPGVEECRIEGVGHLLQIQHPEPVAKGVAEFLHRHPMTGGAPDSLQPTETVSVPTAIPS